MISSGSGPTVACRPVALDSFPPWERMEQGFARAEPVGMSQAWLDTPQEELMPTLIRVGWSSEALWIWADLADRDIFNSATKPNELTHLTGDVFEIFLKEEGRDPYVEMHVTPENQHLQLRFPSEAATRASASPLNFIVKEPMFASLTRVEPGRWQVLGRVPAQTVTGRDRIRAGERWRFSFSRYDYTRGRPEPVLSSTSPHRELSFHRQEEWGTLVFAE